MGGEYTRRLPQVVVVGSASRDVGRADPRGWRLGGGVTYGALALARLGLSVGAVIGVDGAAASAWELDLLGEAGVAVHRVRLPHGPVFTNEDRAGVRHQLCNDPGEPVDVSAVPARWLDAPAWLMAPIAGELAGAWAGVPPATAVVALGWQGLLRRLESGRPVRRRPAEPHPLLARASIVGVSVHDLAPSLTFARLAGWIGTDRGTAAGSIELVITAGKHGGVDVRLGHGGLRGWRTVPAFASPQELDATGAGDVFLAALLAGRLAAEGRRPRTDQALAVAAAAASLATEGIGVSGVPTLAQVARRVCAPPRSAANA